jgi:3,4-dihydroxy 2-butanone 4-phosphate synthase/GTP cyclohydrolase II
MQPVGTESPVSDGAPPIPDPFPAVMPGGRAVTDLGRGLPIIVVDGGCGEESGSFVAAARDISEDSVMLMLVHGLGRIRVCIAPEREAELGLDQDGIGAGRERVPSVRLRGQRVERASVEDYAETIRALADPAAGADDFVTPGHVLAIGIEPELHRGDAAEQYAAIVRGACAGDAAAFCPIVGEDGKSASLETLATIAIDHTIPIVRSDAPAAGEAARQPLRRAAQAQVPLERAPGFQAYGYEDPVDGREYLALVLGDPTVDDPVVAVHAACIWGDVFRSRSCGCQAELQESMRRITASGTGVLVYIGRGHAELLDVKHGSLPSERWVDVLDDLGVRGFNLIEGAGRPDLADSGS